MGGRDTGTADTLLSDAATTAALADDAVVRWWQTTTFLEVAGPDAPTLLDGLCTQAVERIAPGAGVPGLFLDAKAKIIAPAVVHRMAPRAWTDPRTAEVVADAPQLLLETLPDLVEPLRAHLARYRLRARVTLIPESRSSLALVGSAAAAAATAVDPGSGAWSLVSGTARPTAAWIGDAGSCSQLVREVLPAAGYALADPDALERDRIERGIAGLHDLLPGRMPAEVGGMESAVALDAGCYLGQEPVARLHYRGHPNRTLRRLVADAPLQPAAEAPGAAALELRRAAEPDAARPVGLLTTWAARPDGATVALGVMRREVHADEPLVLCGTSTSLRAVDEPPG